MPTDTNTLYQFLNPQIRHEVSFKNMTHKLCSDHCFNRYRMANGLIMNCCEHCGEYLPSKGAANNILMVDGEPKRFCCQNCVSEYKQVSLVSILFNDALNSLIGLVCIYDNLETWLTE